MHAKLPDTMNLLTPKTTPVLRLLLGLSLFFSQTSVFAESNRGEELFLENCAICHGNDGQGGVGVPLALDDFLKSASADYLHQTIRLGRPDRIMPSFYWMPESDINEIIKFIDTWRVTPAPTWSTKNLSGNPVSGKALYEKNCQVCHGANAKGAKGSGLRFSRKQGLAMTPPALNNQGLLYSAPDSMLHYIITHGRKGTPMPSAKTLGLSDSNINDIVSYLRSFQKANLTHKSLYHEEPASLIVESSYTFDETVENVKRAITGSNFVHIRDQALTHGFKVEKSEHPRQEIIYFCSFSFLYEALKIDPRAGVFLPCRVTVVEQDGKIQIMSINPKHLSQLFNNNELKESCDKMYDVYSGILEDASL